MASGRHILLGAGGHARVVLALARAAGLSVAGVCDPALHATGVRDWHGCPVLGDEDTVLAARNPAGTGLLNGIGFLPGSRVRARLQARWQARGFDFPVLVHPAAWVDPDSALETGTQVMAGAVVQPGCRIGEGCILNTGATVDHDCNIGQQVHIAPGATLCGDITVGDGTFIGAGATLINGLKIGRDAVIAAGATQTTDLPGGARSFGRQSRRRQLSEERGAE